MPRRPTAPPPSRKERARATRQRMVEAAYELITSQGFATTTVAEVAEAAGVAVQTVYFTFGSKAGLLREAFQYAVLGDDRVDLGPHEREWFGRLQHEAALVPALRIAVDEMTTIIRRVVPLTPAVQMLGDDPDVAAWTAHGERLRRIGYAQVVDALVDKHPLRPGVTLDDAVTVLLTWVGPDVYRAMVLTHGWTDDAWREWTVRTTAETLFGVVD